MCGRRPPVAKTRDLSHRPARRVDLIEAKAGIAYSAPKCRTSTPATAGTSPFRPHRHGIAPHGSACCRRSPRAERRTIEATLRACGLERLGGTPASRRSPMGRNGSRCSRARCALTRTGCCSTSSTTVSTRAIGAASIECCARRGRAAAPGSSRRIAPATCRAARAASSSCAKGGYVRYGCCTARTSPD